MSKNDGGPAFPRLDRSVPDSLTVRGAAVHYEHRSVGGMSLRDWFAGQATEDDVRWWRTDGHNNRSREQAKYAYADAMLAAREGG